MPRANIRQNNEQILRYLFWILPFLLLLFQFIVTKNSLFQIRYEELGESVRDVYWLAHRQVYDSISTDVGFFAQLLVFYKIFGFSIFAAKWFRLVLSVFSLFCATYLVLKYIGPKFGWVTLLAFGLSPTFLYFNTIQSEYGLDLQYLPIFLFALDKIELQKSKSGYFWIFLLFSLLMLNWTGYPIFIFYIPAVFWLFFLKIKKSGNLRWPLAVAMFGFLTPLAAILAYVTNRNLLIYDPVLGGGLFRGGGKFEFGPVLTNFKALIIDLFDKGNSYYFEVRKADFADYWPILPIITIFVLVGLIWKRSKQLRPLILAIGSVLILNLVVSGLALDISPPGLRRYTGVLASFYLLLAIVCYWFSRQRLKGRLGWWFIVLILSLVPFHHILVFGQNLQGLKTYSAWGTQPWFTVAGTPDKSLELFVSKVQQSDLMLSCLDEKNEFIQGCRYGEIYAAIAGSCLWNNLACHKILAYDEKSKDHIPLTIDLWANNYFSH